MNVWFMFDCHVFVRVGSGTTSRSMMEAKARELFAENGSGSLFARDADNRFIADLSGSRTADGWAVTAEQLREFFDAVDEVANWEARG